MSEKHECNEKDLEQVTGGAYYNVDFRCPACGFKVHMAKSGVAIGEEGPSCPQCLMFREQTVKMIRIK